MFFHRILTSAAIVACLLLPYLQAGKPSQNLHKTKAKVEDVKLPSWYGKNIKKKEITKEEQEELESLLSEFE